MKDTIFIAEAAIEKYEEEKDTQEGLGLTDEEIQEWNRKLLKTITHNNGNDENQ